MHAQIIFARDGLATSDVANGENFPKKNGVLCAVRGSPVQDAIVQGYIKSLAVSPSSGYDTSHLCFTRASTVPTAKTKQSPRSSRFFSKILVSNNYFWHYCSAT